MASLDLDGFVSQHTRKPWADGRVDCLLTLADWFVWRGYPDPAEHLRGQYDSEEGYRRIIAKAGGAVPLVNGCADSIGLTRADRQRVGSIAVIGSFTNWNRQFGAIWDGSKWLIRTKDGFVKMIARPLSIWDET